MEQVEKLIKKIFVAMGFGEPKINIRKDNSSRDRELIDVNLDISPREAECFLKENGEGLSALQHLVRLLIFKQTPSQSFVVLDINGYKDKRKNELVELALEAAKKVRRTKKSVALEPMSAYERRIIHLKLAEQPDIVTESIGEEPERRIMVRLYP